MPASEKPAQLPTFEMIKKAAIWGGLIALGRMSRSYGFDTIVVSRNRPPRSSEFSCSPGRFGVKVDAAHDDAGGNPFELPA